MTLIELYKCDLDVIRVSHRMQYHLAKESTFVISHKIHKS